MFTISILLLIVLASASTLVAQKTSPDVSPCNEEFAKFLVEQQVAESRSVPEADQRVRILVRAADFLWSSDQPSARELFAEAFKIAGADYNERFSRFSEKSVGRGSVPPTDHRYEVIRAVAAKDAGWAKSLIDQVAKEYERVPPDETGSDRNREIDDLLRLGIESLKTNPDLSRHLFRRVMRHPLDLHWLRTLYSVAGQDPQLSNELYSELLSNYASASPRRLLFLSAYPFAAPRILGPQKFTLGLSVPASIQPNRTLQQRFINTYLQRAVAYASDPRNLEPSPEQARFPDPVFILSALAELEPIVIQHFPAFIQRLSEARGLANGMLSEQMRKRARDFETFNESLGYSFERRLKEVERAESEGKLTDYMIVNLLTWGDDRKTEDQFKQIEPWLDKIAERPTREATINYYWFLRSQLAIKEGRFDDAEKFAAKVPEVEHRAILLFEIAEKQLSNVNNAATVYSTLREIGRLAEQAQDSVEKARVLLGLANKYLNINPVFAMQELSDAVKVVNRLERPDLTSNYTRREIRGRDVGHFVTFSVPGYNLESTFLEISKNNFEMSLSNAKSLNDRYLRALAVFAIAKNCSDVRKTKKPTSPKTGSM